MLLFQFFFLNSFTDLKIGCSNKTKKISLSSLVIFNNIPTQGRKIKLSNANGKKDDSICLYRLSFLSLHIDLFIKKRKKKSPTESHCFFKNCKQMRAHTIQLHYFFEICFSISHSLISTLLLDIINNSSLINFET